MSDKLTFGAYKQPDGTYDAAAKVVYDPPIDGVLFRSGQGACGYKYWLTAFPVSLFYAYKVWKGARRHRR